MSVLALFCEIIESYNYFFFLFDYIEYRRNSA